MIKRRHFLMMAPALTTIAAVSPPLVFTADAPKIVHASDIKVSDPLRKAI